MLECSNCQTPHFSSHAAVFLPNIKIYHNQIYLQTVCERNIEILYRNMKCINNILTYRQWTEFLFRQISWRFLCYLFPVIGRSNVYGSCISKNMVDYGWSKSFLKNIDKRFSEYKIMKKYYFLKKNRGECFCSELRTEPWLVVTTMANKDQWRQSGVSKRQNPPCFLLQLLVPGKSSRNFNRAQ